MLMDSEQSTCCDNIDNTEQRRDSVKSGRDRPSSTGGDVIPGTCVICGLHKPEPLSCLGHGTNTFLEHCTAAGNRVTTCLENLEMSGNLEHVREMSEKKSCHRKVSQNCSLLDEY